MHAHRFKQDVARWIEQEKISPLSAVTLTRTLKLLYRHLPLRAMLWFRIGAWFHDRGVPLVPSFVQRQIYRRFGLEIAVGQEIGGGLYIAHPIGTVISVSRMGENCTIINSVTIGMRSEWGFPVIGDRVFFGAGARVLGTITVGDDALIGANAVVLKDVAPGTTVVGIPARPVGQSV